MEFTQPSTRKVAVDNNPAMWAKYQNNQMIPVAEGGLEDSWESKENAHKIRAQQRFCSFSLHPSVTLSSIKAQSSSWFGELHPSDTGCNLFKTKPAKMPLSPFTAGWSPRRTNLAGLNFGQSNCPGKFSSHVLAQEGESGSVWQWGCKHIWDWKTKP